MTAGKTTALTRWTFVGKVMSLLFNTLSRLVIALLPRSKRLSISWLQSPSAVLLEPKKIKSVTVSIVSPSICYEVMGLDAMIFVFWMLNFKPAFSLSSFTFIQKFFSSSLLSAIRVVSSAYTSPGNLDSSLCSFSLAVLNSGRALRTLPKSSKHSNLGLDDDNNDDDDIAAGPMWCTFTASSMSHNNHAIHGATYSRHQVTWSWIGKCWTSYNKSNHCEVFWVDHYLKRIGLAGTG